MWADGGHVGVRERAEALAAGQPCLCERWEARQRGWRGREGRRPPEEAGATLAQCSQRA